VVYLTCWGRTDQSQDIVCIEEYFALLDSRDLPIVRLSRYRAGQLLSVVVNLSQLFHAVSTIKDDDVMDDDALSVA
jgi:hypothetical protein